MAPPSGAMEPGEHAKVLRMGVAAGWVDLRKLARTLGCSRSAALREAYCRLWASGWATPYVQVRKALFDEPRPPRLWITRRNPRQKYARQCGRLLLDAMRNL